jgi:hypothetical protein
MRHLKTVICNIDLQDDIGVLPGQIIKREVLSSHRMFVVNYIE